MIYEKSCGALVVRREGEKYFVLMIRHKAKGNRSFPKGHVEAGVINNFRVKYFTIPLYHGGKPW